MRIICKIPYILFIALLMPWSHLQAGEKLPTENVAIQSNGLQKCLYHFDESTRRVKVFDLTLEEWSDCGELAIQEPIRSVVTGGASMIYVLADKLYLYHTVMRVFWVDESSFPGLEIASMQREGKAYRLTLVDGSVITAEPKQNTKAFGIFNLSIVVLYFLGMVAMGLYFSRRKESMEEFFLADRKMKAWPVAVSASATLVSTISYISSPAKVFSGNWHTILYYLCATLAAPLIYYKLIPLYRSKNFVSIYAYLEKRFNRFLYKLSSLFFLLFQLGRVGIVLFLSSLILSTMMGLSFVTCVILITFLTWFYTSLGGIRAVIWSDVVQMGILLCSLPLILFCMWLRDPNIWSQYATAVTMDQKMRLYEVFWHLKQPSLVFLVFGGIASTLCANSDQSVIQRYLTTKSVKTAQKGYLGNVVLDVVISILLGVIGTALYAFYKAHPVALNPAQYVQEGIFPHYILNEMPFCIPGIIVAAAFAAGMSTLDSSLSSIATVSVTDFLRVKEEKKVVVGRRVMLLVALFSAGSALLIHHLQVISCIDLAVVIKELTMTNVTGLILLGLLTKRANATGALIAVCLNICFVLLLLYVFKVHFFGILFLSIAFVFVAGYLLSLFFHSSGKLGPYGES